eukprot:TRINITY_DN15710_c0_g1_i1.p1 TRINITY_DN15710_c0_g1~~TRINITY_DN15710_c0_g1_i1.p1  ORF type:complete len:441 (-),score=72.17 TRINITY_DN15710_c0_g1_i1:78-1250(-)
MEANCTRTLAAGITLQQLLWAVPVTRHQVSSHVTNPLQTVISALAKRSPSVRKSNRGGWHSAASSLLDETAATSPMLARQLRLLLLGAAGEYLLRAAQEAAAGGPALAGEVALSLSGVWANVNGHGHSNVAHSHPGLLSGALYVQPGRAEGAILCLADPRSLKSSALPEGMANSSMVKGGASWRRWCGSVEAADSAAGVALFGLEAGDLVIFPSWLLHHVPPHVGNMQRISISFNVRAEVVNPRGPLRLKFEDADLLDGDIGTPVQGLELVEAVQLFGSDAILEPSRGEELHLGDLVPVEEEEDHLARRSKPSPALAAALAAGTVKRWRCLAQHLPSLQPLQATGTRAGTGSSVALLSLPAGFVQSVREQRPELAAVGAAVGFHGSRGTG